MSADIRLLRWPDRQRDDYERLVTALARVRESVAKARGELTVTVPTAPEEPSDLDRARVLLAQRRARDAAAGPYADMFADPAWDMLLTLFVADGEGSGEDMTGDIDRVVAASSITRPAALRWIALLVERGFVTGKDVPSLTDAGRTFVGKCIGAA